MPEITPVLGLSDKPEGKVLVVVQLNAVGYPVTVGRLVTPETVAVNADVAVGATVAASFTVSVKVWVAVMPTTLVAVKVRL